MPTQRETLLALRERVLAAKGADPILDRRICIALGAEPWTRAQVNWDPEEVMPKSKIARETPALTGSADAMIALIERDQDFQADPKGFVSECTIYAPPTDIDLTRPLASQAARHMLAGYLGVKAALASHEAANVE